VTGSQSIVGAGGIGLVLANFWFGSNRKVVSAGLFGNGDPSAAHQSLLVLGGEALFVIVATLLAGISDSWGAAMAVLIVALWVLWAINHYAGGTQTQSASAGGAAA
jgi:hypothetical protein